MSGFIVSGESAGLIEAGRLAIAAVIGLAVGIERQWSGHATGPMAHFAGMRTFLLIGLLGGAAGLLISEGLTAAGATLIAGACAFIVVAYYLAARRDGGDLDGTTEGAALLVLALGVLAGIGKEGLAAGAVAVVILALREKNALHTLVRHIGEVEMRAALQFAVIALVILPLLPVGPYGPLGGVRPRWLWGIVVALAAVNFAGYIARRAIGPHRGFAITGLLGGIFSSTLVTLQFARASRDESGTGTSRANGVAAACTVLLPRLMALTAALRPSLALELVPYLAPPFAVGALLTLNAFRGRPDGDGESVEVRNPLGLRAAIRMTLFFQAAIVVITLAESYVGRAGVVVSSALFGLTDMDALAVSMSRLAADPGPVSLAALGIGVGLLSNTLFKLGLALWWGSNEFRRATGVRLGALALGSAAGLWLGAM